MLTILVTATDEKLTNLENVKEVLDLTDTKYDELIIRYIDRASRRVVSYVGKPLALTQYQAILPAYGGINLQLPTYPIRNVIRAFEGTDTGLDLELTSTDYRVDKDRGWLNRDSGWTWTRQTDFRQSVPAELIAPGSEFKKYLVEYNAGYVLKGGLTTASSLWTTADGSTATGSTLPDDYEEATIELVRVRFLGRLREPGTLTEKIGDTMVRYGERDKSGLPDSVRDILDPLRSMI